MKSLKIKYYSFFAVVVLSILFVQCRTDEIDTQIIPSPILGKMNVSFLVTVVDEKNDQLFNASVIIHGNGEPIMADDNGILLIDNLSTSGVGIGAEFFKEGYENQMVNLVGTQGEVTPVTVKMVKLKTKWIETDSDGQLSSGNIVTLPTTLEYANGDKYSGAVEVRSIYQKHNDTDLLSSTLGNMQSLSKDGEYKLLGSLGMFKIALFDQDENELFIPNESSIHLKIALDDIPSDVDLSDVRIWELDRNIALWTESTSVTVDGQYLVIEIKHTSWINIGLDFNFNQTSLLIKDQNGVEVPHLKVQFRADNALFNKVFTDANSTISLNLPIDRDIIVEYSYDGESYSQSIGIFDGTGESNSLVLESLDAYVITGIAQDCSMGNVNSGYSILSFDEEKSSFSFTNGLFQYVNVLEDHSLRFLDRSTGQSIGLEVNPTIENIILDDVFICDEDLAKVSGYVLLDSDEDGVGDVPLSGQSVYLSSDNIILHQSTNFDGYYEFAYMQEDSVYVRLDIDPSQYVIYQSGDISPESMDASLGYESGFAIKNLTTIEDNGNNFILINQGQGNLAGTYMADSNGDGFGDVALEWLEIKSIDGELLGYVESNGEFDIERPNGYGEIWAGFYEWMEDYDSTPDPDGDDSNEGPNGKIPYFINSDEVDSDNNLIIDLDFSAIVVQVIEDTDGDGIGDTHIEEGRVNIKHLIGGPLMVSSSIDLSEGKYAIDEFGISLAELHEVTLEMPFDFEILSIEDLSPDNDPAPTADTMMIRTLGAEWDGGNTFTIRKI